MSAAPSNLELPDDVRRQSIIAILISTFGAGITFGIGYPLVSLTLEAWKEPAWVIGVAGGAPWLAIFLTLPFLPRILRRLGPVKTSVLGCIICAAAYLAMYGLQSTTAWIAIRFVQGAATALPWLIGETWINSVTRNETRTRVVAVYALVFFAGFAVGPLLIDWTGTEGFLPFAVSAAGPLFAAIPIVLARHLAPSMISAGTTGVIASARKVPAAMASSFTGGVIESIYFSLLPTASLAAGLDTERALRLLTVFIIGGLAIQLVIGWIGDRISRTRLVQVLGLANVVLTLALSGSLADPLLGPALVFVIGGVTIGFYTLGLALLGEGLDARDLAAGNSAYIMMYTAGAVIGPAIAGAIMSSAPMFGFIASNIVAAILFLAAVALIPRRPR